MHRLNNCIVSSPNFYRDHLIVTGHIIFTGSLIDPQVQHQPQQRHRSDHQFLPKWRCQACQKEVSEAPSSLVPFYNDLVLVVCCLQVRLSVSQPQHRGNLLCTHLTQIYDKSCVAYPIWCGNTPDRGRQALT